MMWKCPACRSLLATEVVARAAPDDVCPVCNFESMRSIARPCNVVSQAPAPPHWSPAPPHWIVAESVMPGGFWVEERLGGPLQKRNVYRRRPDAQAVADWLNERDAGYPPRPGLMP